LWQHLESREDKMMEEGCARRHKPFRMNSADDERRNEENEEEKIGNKENEATEENEWNGANVVVKASANADTAGRRRFALAAEDKTFDRAPEQAEIQSELAAKRPAAVPVELFASAYAVAWGLASALERRLESLELDRRAPSPCHRAQKPSSEDLPASFPSLLRAY
jgi:hypothetical protein